MKRNTRRAQSRAARTAADADAVSDVAARLHSAAIHLLRGLRREDDASGMSAARLSALSVLVFGGACTLGELAAAEQVSAPTMSRLARALEAEGLVERAADDVDGRVVWLRATAKARRALAAARARRLRRLREDLGGLDADELDTLSAAADLIERMLAGPGARSRGAPSGG